MMSKESANDSFAGGLSVATGEIDSRRASSADVQVDKRDQFETINNDVKRGSDSSPDDSSDDSSDFDSQRNVDDKSSDGGGPSDYEDKIEHRTWVKIRWMRMKIGGIVNNEVIQVCIILLIIANSILMGIGTFDVISEDPKANDIFEKADRVFLIIFTVELCMQFTYHGFKLLLDGWLVFDLIIIVFSWSFEQVQIIRAFRIFRALRLITRIKTLRNLVMALFTVLPNLAAICCLLALIFYIFAVMFTTLFKHVEGEYFRNLQNSVFTLFQFMTLDYVDIVRPIVQDNPMSAWFFLVYLTISGFIVFNLIVAVVVDAVSLIENESDEEENEHLLDNNDEDSEFDSMTRIKELHGQVSTLLQKQRSMDEAMGSLANDICRLHKFPLPPEP